MGAPIAWGRGVRGKEERERFSPFAGCSIKEGEGTKKKMEKSKEKKTSVTLSDSTDKGRRCPSGFKLSLPQPSTEERVGVKILRLFGATGSSTTAVSCSCSRLFFFFHLHIRKATVSASLEMFKNKEDVKVQKPAENKLHFGFSFGIMSQIAEVEENKSLINKMVFFLFVVLNAKDESVSHLITIQLLLLNSITTIQGLLF